MLTFFAIVVMMIAGLRILWDGQIPVSRTRVASGWSAKVMGFSLLLAAPIAYGVTFALSSPDLRGIVPSLSDDDRDYLFITLFLGIPAAAATLAILLSKPIGERRDAA
jgi:hypothetical protein